jgi:hypothetical protein
MQENKPVVWCVAPGVVVSEDVAAPMDEAGTFSFPRPVADENTRKKQGGSLDGVEAEVTIRDGPALWDPAADWCPGRELRRLTLAGWEVARDL